MVFPSTSMFVTSFPGLLDFPYASYFPCTCGVHFQGLLPNSKKDVYKSEAAYTGDMFLANKNSCTTSSFGGRLAIALKFCFPWIGGEKLLPGPTAMIIIVELHLD